MVYSLLKLICRIALKVFYKKIDVNKTQFLPANGPLLIVSNHPNTFMDPIVIASLFKQEVYFIAKSTVFSSPFRKWLLQKMNLIPVYRKEDGPVSAGANNATFQKCFEFLDASGTLLIFPEGNSFNQRRLRPLKTGTARIALGAAARNNFTREVNILPIGLNYSEPTRFRSKLLVNIGSLIQMSDYALSFQEDEGKEYKLVTEHIRIALEELIIHTYSNEDDELVHQVETVYKNKLLADIGIPLSKAEEEFKIVRGIVDSLAYFKKHNPERVRQLQQNLKNYLQKLKTLRLNYAVVTDPLSCQSLGYLLLTSILQLLLGFPLYLYGLITNYIPYILPAKVAGALTEEEEFVAPILMTTGIFTFPFFYGVEVYLVWYFTGSFLLALCFLISLPLAGFFVLGYYAYLKRIVAQFKWRFLLVRKNEVVSKLNQQRQYLIKELEMARDEYLQVLK